MKKHLFMAMLLVSFSSTAGTIERYKQRYSSLPCSGIQQVITDVEIRYKLSSDKKKNELRKKAKALRALWKERKCFGIAYH